MVNGEGERGRGGASIVRGHGRVYCSAYQSNPEPTLKLTKSMRSFIDGWKEVTKDNIQFQIMMEEEYNKIDNGDMTMTTYLNIHDQIIGALTRKGLDCTTTDIFTHLLSDTVSINISEYATEKLVKHGFYPTNVHEFKNFVGTRWLRSRIKLGTTMVFNDTKETTHKYIDSCWCNMRDTTASIFS